MTCGGAWHASPGPHQRSHDGAGARPAGLRQPSPALPDDHVDIATAIGAIDDPLDVGALG